MLRLTVTQDRALNLLRAIPHQKCQGAIAGLWKVEENGRVKPQSVCWLYCWGKTGMGSERAAEAARQAFNNILDFTFEAFDACVPHQWARGARYSGRDIGPALEVMLAR